MLLGSPSAVVNRVHFPLAVSYLHNPSRVPAQTDLPGISNSDWTKRPGGGVMSRQT